MPAQLQRETRLHGVTLSAMEVEAMAVPTLVELVNGWGTVPRARADDRPLASRAAFVDAHAVPAELVTHCADDALVRVADRLHAVFAAATAEERAALVTALLARCGVRPAVRAADGRIRSTWQVARPDDGLLAAAAVALRAQLAEHDPARV